MTLKRRVHGIKIRAQIFGVCQVLQEIDDLEWRSRNLNLEFHGISVSEDEDVLIKINKMEAKIDVRLLTADDVITAHRQPVARDKVPGIIVRLARQSLKDSLMSERRELCYIMGNLTKRASPLLAVTKEWAKYHKHKHVWHRKNKNYVKWVDGGRAFMYSLCQNFVGHGDRGRSNRAAEQGRCACSCRLVARLKRVRGTFVVAYVVRRARQVLRKVSALN